MKSNFPRHANVPADFIFIGKGGTFEPAYRDAYYYVTKDGFCEALNFHCEKSDYADSEGVDFYVKKNGPTHLLNKPKVKKKTVDAIPGLVWPAVVNKEGTAKDLIYVGQGNVDGINGLCGHDAFSFGAGNGQYSGSSDGYVGNCIFYHYFVPKDHPILAKYKTKNSAELKKENATLKAENEALKARILKFEKIIEEARNI